MFFLISVGAPTIFGPACALRTDPSGIKPSAAPAAKPDRCKNVRRSRTPEARPAATPCKRARPADPSLRLISMCVVPSIAVDAIVVLDVIGFLVARLDALGLRLVRFGLAARQRHDRSRSYRRSTHHEEAAPVHACRRLRLALAGERFTVGWLAHCDLLQVIFSKSIVWVPSASSGQRKGLGFQFHKDTADTADGTVEIGRAGQLKIGEHPRSPRLEMPLEEARLLAEGSFEVAAREAGHDLQHDRDVIFWLPRDACALDSEPIQVFADT